MLRVVKPDRLPAYLAKIRRAFPSLLHRESFSGAEISEYYRDSFIGYHLLHSDAGAIHMAISRDGKFRKNDYFRQAEDIADIALSRGTTGTLVEAGCGKAFNLSYLSSVLPEWRCIGVDLTGKHIEWAQRAFRDRRNLQLFVSDYGSLEELLPGPVQIVFFVESLCHARNIGEILRVVYRVLEAGGQLVVYDGFRGNSTITTPEMQEAVGLVETAMAVPQFMRENVFRELAASVGFRVEREDDLTTAIMPNLLRLSDFAKAYFRFPPMTRLLAKLLPKRLVCNSVAGLLMPLTVSCGAHVYKRFILIKPCHAQGKGETARK